MSEYNWTVTGVINGSNETILLEWLSDEGEAIEAYRAIIEERGQKAERIVAIRGAL